MQVLPFWIVEELEVDDQGGQEVEDGEVGEEESDQLFVIGLSAALELVDFVQVALYLFKDIAG